MTFFLLGAPEAALAETFSNSENIFDIFQLRQIFSSSEKILPLPALDISVIRGARPAGDGPLAASVAPEAPNQKSQFFLRKWALYLTDPQIWTHTCQLTSAPAGIWHWRGAPPLAVQVEPKGLPFFSTAWHRAAKLWVKSLIPCRNLSWWKIKLNWD